MPMSAEAASRFVAYVAHTDPSNIEVGADGALFDFVGWALVHEPDALIERFTFESTMSERGFGSNKMAYVQTVVAVAQPLLLAYERARNLTECTTHVK
jgi:hypothetical protein